MDIWNNKTITFGVLIAVLGWIWLIFFPSIGSEFASRQIVNLHTLALAQGVINLGYFVAFMGLLHAGFVRMIGAQKH